jgi:hypothetical protein
MSAGIFSLSQMSLCTNKFIQVSLIFMSEVRDIIGNDISIYFNCTFLQNVLEGYLIILNLVFFERSKRFKSQISLVL